MNSNYGWGLPVAASTYAGKIDGALNLLHGVMIAIFVLWAIYMAYCLFAYRQAKHPVATYSKEHSKLALLPDWIILAFEVWLIFIVGIPIWAHIREELPKPENSVVVNMTAEQFAWTFHYPGPDGKFGKQAVALVNSDNPLGLDSNDEAGKDDLVSVNELHIPLGKPVLLTMSSKDVIHSFFVPEFRTKQDVVPGMRIPIWFEPTLEGRFEIGCAQLCGTGHYKMRGDVFVKSPQEYDAWLAQKAREKLAAAPAPASTEVWE